MARIVRFKEIEATGRSRPHSEVDCGYSFLTATTGRVVQLDTYGSDSREIPGKVSQSFQVDRDGAAQLVAILQRAFPDLK
jgi:hypothetical protein